MHEPPDFERIADVCLARVHEVRSKGLIAEHSVVVEQLRQVWNARGAADIEAKNAAFRVGVGLGGALSDLEDEAIKKLDR